MTKPTQKDTWQSIGSVARILAGKLVVARELEKMAAAPTGESDGQGGLRGDAAKESGRPEGRIHGRPSAAGSNALIGGQMARAESEIHLVGISPTPGRVVANAPRTPGRASIR